MNVKELRKIIYEEISLLLKEALKLNAGDSIKIPSISYLSPNDGKTYNVLAFVIGYRYGSSRAYYISESPVTLSGNVVSVNNGIVEIKLDSKSLLTKMRRR